MRLNLTEFDYKKEPNLKKQRKLFKQCFPEAINTSVETEDHYKWKFHSIPGKIKSYEYIAEVEDDFVGYYAALPYFYVINKERHTAGMVCDVMTHSQMRGQGIFTKMGQFSTDALMNENISFAIGYPIRKSVIPGHLKVGWKIAFDLPLYLAPLRINSLFKYFHIFFNSLLFLYHQLLKLLFNRTYDDISISFDKFENFKCWDQYHLFYQSWTKEQCNYLVKEKDFLKWRCGAPGRNYWIATLKIKEKMVGFSIFRFCELNGIQTASILDYMLLNKYQKYSTNFIFELKKFAKTSNVDVLACMMSPYWRKKYHLLKSGFIKSPYIFKLILKTFKSDLEDYSFYSDEKWHLMWIDSDNI